MSQPGLLNDDEIKNYLNENFGLKLKTESISKPTAPVIIDIYEKFLDDSHFPWRTDSREAEENSLPEDHKQARAIKWLRFIINRYNCNFSFNRTDLIQPNRRRTVTFLNILIYFKAQLDEKRVSWIERKRQHQLQVGDNNRSKEHLKAARVERDNLAVIKSQLPSRDDLLSSIELEQKPLNDLKDECDKLYALSIECKKEVEIVEKSVKQEQEELELLRQKLLAEEASLETQDKALRAEDEGRNLKSQIREEEDRTRVLRDKINQSSERLSRADLEASKNLSLRAHLEHVKQIKAEYENLSARIEEAKLVNNRKQSEFMNLVNKLNDTKAELEELKKRHFSEIHILHAELEKQRAKTKSRRQEIADECDMLRKRIEADKELIKAEDLKREAFSGLTLTHIEMVRSRHEAFKERVASLKQVHEEDLKRDAEHGDKLRTFLGLKKETQDGLGNRTYVKESKEN